MKNFGKSGFLVRAAGCGLAVVLSVAAVPSARAAVLASYPFTGSSLASTDLDPASVASPVAVGSGLTSSTRFVTDNGNAAPSLRIGADETDGTTFPTATTAGDFFTASLTPGSGERLVFTTLTFDLAVSAATVTTNVLLQASVDGGNTYANLSTFANFSTTAFTTETVDLSGRNSNAAVANGAAVFFRLVVYDNANGATLYTAFDNITINGTVTPIPEPGTAALLALGVLFTGGVVLRRRRRHAALY